MAQFAFDKTITRDDTYRVIDALAGAAQHSDSLHLYISSSGGSVGSALIIAQLLSTLEGDVCTYNCEHVGSAAILLFASGRIRIADPKAEFYFHPISSDEASRTDVVATAAEEDMRHVADFLFTRTGTSADRWLLAMRRSERMSGLEAVSLGLATEIRMATRPLDAIHL